MSDGLTTRNDEATDYPPIPPGIYESELLSITERTGIYGPYWSWKWATYEFDGGDGEGRWLWCSSHNNTNPAYTRGKSLSPRQIAAAIMGTETIPDHTFRDGLEYESLVGGVARLMVGVGKSRDGRAINVVTGVLPALDIDPDIPFFPESESPENAPTSTPAADVGPNPATGVSNEPNPGGTSGPIAPTRRAPRGKMSPVD